MSSSGMLVEVQVLARGSAATGDVAAGSTVVPVEDVTQFDDAGGTVQIDGTAYDYMTLDKDASTLTLAAPLTADVSEFDPVLVMAGGQVVQDWQAIVDLGGEGDTVSVPIPYGLRSILGEGQYDPPVPVDVADDLSTVLDVPGRAPVIDGGMIDPATLPAAPAPSEPPASSPTLNVQSLSDMLIVTASDVDPTTTINYHISTSPGFVPDLTTLAASTRSTVLAINELPDGTPLAKNVTYALVAVASNVAGSAAPSPEIDATLSDVGVTIAADNVVGGSFTSAYSLTGSLKVGNISITPGSSIDPGGLMIPLSSGGVIQFPADGSPATIQAHIDILSGTVTDHLTINGRNNDISGAVTLDSTPTAPTKTPTVYVQALRTGAGWQQITTLGNPALSTMSGTLLATSTAWIFLGVDSTDPNKIKVPVISVNRSTGVASIIQPDLLTLIWPDGIGYVQSLATDGTNWYVLYSKTEASQQYVRVFNASWTRIVDYNAGSSWSANGATTITYNTATQNVVLAGMPQTGSHANMVTATVRKAADGTFVKENYYWQGNPGDPIPVSVVIGPCDFGVSRMVVMFANGAFVVFAVPTDANPIVEYTAQSTGLGTQIKGMAWVSDLNRFVALIPSNANTYDIRSLSNVATTTSRVIGWTQYCTGTRSGSTGPSETKLSPTVTYTQPARSFMTISTPMPTDAGAANDPDSTRVYVDNHLQATLPDTGTMSYTVETPTTTGQAAPTVEGFLSATGGTLGVLQSQAVDTAGNALISLKGDGSARLAMLVQAGVVAANTTANTPTSTAVIFATPFPAGVVPVVNCTPQGQVPGTQILGVSAGSITNTGFQVWLDRTTSGITNVMWTAIAATQ